MRSAEPAAAVGIRLPSRYRRRADDEIPSSAAKSERDSVESSSASRSVLEALVCCSTKRNLRDAGAPDCRPRDGVDSAVTIM